MSAVFNRGTPVFRGMREDDLDTVMEIEHLGYAQPWTRGIFSDCLRVGYLCQVLEIDGVVQAYGVMSSGGGEAHVLNLCVRRQSQRQGLGRLMLLQLVEAARRLHVDLVLLEVRPSNRSALALYESVGFSEVGVRRNYYPAKGGREDALIMALSV